MIKKKTLIFEIFIILILFFGIFLHLYLAVEMKFHFDELNEIGKAFAFETGRRINAFRHGAMYFFLFMAYLPVSDEYVLIIARIINYLVFYTLAYYYAGKIIYSITQKKYYVYFILFLLIYFPSYIFLFQLNQY
jgi:hypothetical protein